jgi:DNA-binding CsgD family transcriptional regulator/tetratricopeptide (TPR) repeat protein
VVSDRGATPEQVAAHLMLAPHRGSEEAVAVLRLAAGQAAERGAADAATAYLERALAEPPVDGERLGVLLELGRLTTMTDGPGAVTHLRAAYAAATGPVLRAEVATMLARTLVFAGTPGEATAFAREAAAELPEELDDARQGLLAYERIGGYMHGLPESEWLADRPEVRGEGIGARMLAATLAWEELIRVGDRMRTIELAQFSLESGELPRVDTGLLWVVATFVQEMAEVDTGDFWDRTLAAAYARGSLFSALSVHLWRGHMLWHRGKLREALHSIRTSNEQSQMWGAPAVGVPYGQAFIIGILLEQGDLAAARAFVDSVKDQARVGDGARLFEENAARLLAAEGRCEEALAALDLTEQMQTSVLNPVWRPWRSYRAGVLACLGRLDEARALMADEIDLARRWGAASVLGRTLRCAGELGGDDAEAMLREGLDLLRPSVARYECARAELALARVTGDPAERRSLLRAALDRSLECGSPGLYREVAAELRADGVDVPADAADVVWVTPTERRVALRAAAGATSRTIAQELFVTPVLIERTLAELRNRLGVATDAELASALPTH